MSLNSPVFSHKSAKTSGTAVIFFWPSIRKYMYVCVFVCSQPSIRKYMYVCVLCAVSPVASCSHRRMVIYSLSVSQTTRGRIPLNFLSFFLSVFIGSGGHTELATWGVGPDVIPGIILQYMVSAAFRKGNTLVSHKQ